MSGGHDVRRVASASLALAATLVLAASLYRKLRSKKQEGRPARAARALPSAQLLGGIAVRKAETKGASAFLSSARRAHGEDAGHFSREVVPPGQGVTLTHWGIEGSNDWHVSEDGVDRVGERRNERGICINSTASYREMRDWLRPWTWFQVGIPTCPETGENLLVSDGLNIDTVCIGDVLQVSGLDSVRLTVTCVRVPCKRYQVHFGSKAVYERVFFRGLSGFFVKVAFADDSVQSRRLITQNATLSVVERPHPSWTLRRVYSLIYGQGKPASKVPKWVGTDEELHELLAIPELMEFQFKAALRKHLESQCQSPQCS